ncbi:unnamed protein product [Rotaria magnacalcarata]|uniref:Uncharacterized protein n=1 Tax=Rotaria magnacalcarata TaxID=392030 RepID=A0A816HDT6_9BILA|nr:unnamed protein product [Rotaria magnacalcarata]CAF5170445.1 unnamed protein product [Rotaria magnacalcarata]
MEPDKEYLLVFHDIKYTNNQKLELLNQRISAEESQNELLKFYADRVQVHYDMQQYQSAIDDISAIEKLGNIGDRIKVLKWKSLVHMNFSAIREEIKLSSLSQGSIDLTFLLVK